jgi:nucleoside-diphosphate-sugar epimerase
MRVLVAGASGVIGRTLVPMLLAAGHEVVGTTRSEARAQRIAELGAIPAVVDVLDAGAIARAVRAARAELVIHQLTDLAGGFGPEQLGANARLREVGTANLVDAAVAAGARRLVAQSGAWLCAPGEGERREADPLRSAADAPDDATLPGVLALERKVLGAPLEGVVLRYGDLSGPGTPSASPTRLPSVQIEAAARAAVDALTRGRPGVYNVVDGGGGVSNALARTELGWTPDARG